MRKNSSQSTIKELLHYAGIGISLSDPCNIHVNNESFYARVLKEGALGLGESYMEGWWDCPRLDVFFEKILSANLGNKIKKSKKLLIKIAVKKWINFQTKKGALEVAKKHYDLEYRLFKNMLGPTMNYTCGYWKRAQNLEESQIHKMELICQKLMLQPGMRLMDIGCGWGALARYAALHYGVQVVGITISKEQREIAQNYCAGLPVDIRFQDYREVKEKFDRIVSVGMFEHVGHLNYFTFMKQVHACLHDNGIFLLHTIGDNITGVPNEWITKYIFPHGMLPSIFLIGKSIENIFVMEDWHNFGADYDKTLLAWHHNFEKNWGELKDIYDERFYRMWRYYLLSCAGSFRARTLQLWQIVLTKKGMRGGYQAIR